MTGAHAWRRCVAVFVASFVTALGCVLAAVILIDPYDTGYFPSPIGPGVVDDNDTTNTVGRGRDPQFNAGIFGNSHGLLIDPARLSSATGLRFVQLTMLGAGPREQLALIRYFVRRHADVGAIVLVADQTWCTHDPDLPNPWELAGYSFPYWLFADSRLRYAAHMLSTQPLGLMRRRILFAMGRIAPLDPAGVAEYPKNWDLAQAIDIPRDRDIPLDGAQISTAFPAIDRLEALMARLPRSVAIVVVMPPIYVGLMHGPDTRQGAELAACKARLAGALARRAAFLDFLIDSPLSRERSNFFDLHHMLANVARAIEPHIVDALNNSRQRH